MKIKQMIENAKESVKQCLHDLKDKKQTNALVESINQLSEAVDAMYNLEPTQENIEEFTKYYKTIADRCEDLSEKFGKYIDSRSCDADTIRDEKIAYNYIIESVKEYVMQLEEVFPYLESRDYQLAIDKEHFRKYLTQLEIGVENAEVRGEKHLAESYRNVKLNFIKKNNKITSDLLKLDEIKKKCDDATSELLCIMEYENKLETKMDDKNSSTPGEMGGE